MKRQRLTSNPPSMLGKSVLNTQRAIACWSKRIRKTLIWSIAMRFLIRTKKRLSPITFFPLINLRLRPPRSVKKIGEEAFQLLESMLPR